MLTRTINGLLFSALLVATSACPGTDRESGSVDTVGDSDAISDTNAVSADVDVIADSVTIADSKPLSDFGSSSDTASDTLGDAGPDTTNDTLEDAGPDTASDTLGDAGPDTASDTTGDTAPDTAGDTLEDTAPDTTSDTLGDTAPDTTSDTAVDTMADAAPDTVTDTAVDTMADAAPDAVTDTAVDTVADAPDAAPDTDTDADSGTAGTRVLWDLAGALAATADNLAFFDYPWPESQRYDADGTLNLSGFPNPAAATGCSAPSGEPIAQVLLAGVSPLTYRQYGIDVVDRHFSAYGNNAAIYLRFDGALDADSLPTPQESLAPDSPILLVNVDPDSPRRGERVPLSVRVFDTSAYLQPNTLAALPYPGFPLAPDALHALVVRRDLRDAEGDLLGVPAAFEQLKTDTPATAQEILYDAAFTELADAGVDRADVAAMTVFRTASPTDGLAAVAAAIDAIADPASLAQVTIDDTKRNANNGYYRIRGSYNALIFQRGDPPYLPQLTFGIPLGITFDPDDTRGALLLDPPPTSPDGSDAMQPRTERLPFELTLPIPPVDGEGPALDLPLVLFAHGTGGSRSGILGSGGEGALLAAEGIATLAIDQVMHGARAHVENLDEDLVSQLVEFGDLVGQDLLTPVIDVLEGGTFFFNPLQIHAAQGNVLQSAVDYIWLAHVFGAVALEIQAQGSARTVSFDPAHIGFMGHSQGGLTGPLTAASARIGATFLSAPGGHLISSLLTKEQPADPFRVKDIMAYVICESDTAANLDHHHPFLSLVMTSMEAGDGVNWARYLVHEPLTTARDVFVSQGVADSYATKPTNEALTSAARMRQVGPELSPVLGQQLLEILEPGGFGLVTDDLAGNAIVGGVPYTSGFKQYTGGCGDDHFVYQCVEEAISDWTTFFSSWLQVDPPTIQGP